MIRDTHTHTHKREVTSDKKNFQFSHFCEPILKPPSSSTPVDDDKKTNKIISNLFSLYLPFWENAFLSTHSNFQIHRSIKRSLDELTNDQSHLTTARCCWPFIYFWKPNGEYIFFRKSIKETKLHFRVDVLASLDANHELINSKRQMEMPCCKLNCLASRFQMDNKNLFIDVDATKQKQQMLESHFQQNNKTDASRVKSDREMSRRKNKT